MITKHAAQDAVHASYVTFRDGEITIGQVFEVQAGSGLVFLAQAHDWDGDSADYDPITVDVTDDLEQAEAAIAHRWEREQAHRAGLSVGSLVTVTAHPGVWVLENRQDDGRVLLTAHDDAADAHMHGRPERSLVVPLGAVSPWVPEPPANGFDPQAAYDELNPKQRAAMRNVLAVEAQYRNGAVPCRAAYSRAATMDALTTRGLLERLITGLPFKGFGFSYGYQLTSNGRAAARLCEEKSVKLAHPADGGDPFAGMGTPDDE